MNIKPNNYYRLYCAFLAMKLIITCLICFGFVGYFGLDQGYLFLIPVLFGPLSLPQRVHQTTWEVALGDVLGVLIFAPLILISHHWLIYFVFNFFLLTLVLLLGFKSRFLFGAIFIVTTGGIMYSMAQTDPEGAISYGIAWSRDAVIGSAVFFIVDFILFPKFAFRQLKNTLENISIRDLPIEDCQKLLQVSRYRISKDLALETEEKIGILGALQFYQKRAELHLEELKKYPRAYLKIHEIYEKFLLDLKKTPEKDLENLAGYLQSYLSKSQPEDLCVIQAGYALKKHMENMARVLSLPKERKIPDPPPFAMAMKSPFKTAFLAIFVLCLVVGICSFLALPGGMQPVFSAFAATLQPNIGKLSKQLLDRFLGVLYGGGASVLILLSLTEMTHFWMLMILFSITVGPFVYLSLSRPQWGYIFLQAAVTVMMMISYDTLVLVPTIEVVGQRFFGISIGFIIGFIVMAIFGLDSATNLFKEKFNNYLKRASVLLFKTQNLGSAQHIELINLISELKILLNHMEFEFGTSQEAEDLFKQKLFLLERIAYNLETLLTLRMHRQQEIFIKTPWLENLLNQAVKILEEILETWPNPQAVLNLKNLLAQMNLNLQEVFRNKELQNLSEPERTHYLVANRNIQSLGDGLLGME